MKIHLLVLCLCITGCSGEAPESLHEVDHFVAGHWPASLADAGSKIETRMAELQKGHDEKVFSELCDIVEWVPEIAADSEMSEADWIPINNASEALSKRLRNASQPALTNLAADLVSFQGQIIRESEKIAEKKRKRSEQVMTKETP